MTVYRTEVLADGLAFPEAPRWHEGRLWFTDQHARAVYALSLDGRLETIAHTGDLPGGLGWLPDGRLLVVHMTERRVMQFVDNGLVEYVDLSGYASFHCNDMLVDSQGNLYVGNFGFDLHGGESVHSAELLRVDVERRIVVVSDRVIFPNGCVITPDGKTLIVAETFGHRLTAISLVDGYRMQPWAALGEATPDGICLDTDNAIWVASPSTNRVMRVIQGGHIVDECETRGIPYACMLGGDSRCTLFVCTAQTDDPGLAATMKSGRIEQVRVPVPGAGFP